MTKTPIRAETPELCPSCAAEGRTDCYVQDAWNRTETKFNADMRTLDARKQKLQEAKQWNAQTEAADASIRRTYIQMRAKGAEAATGYAQLVGCRILNIPPFAE